MVADPVARLPDPIRKLIRRAVRLFLRPAPRQVRGIAVRVPFSRFHRILPYCFWGEEQIAWRGVRVNVNPGAVLGYYAYFLGDYAGDEIDLLIGLCKDAHVLADVGANSGMITLALAQACPQLRIFAFEPDPVIAARFSTNLRLNDTLSPRITLVENAAADVDGRLFFRSAADSLNPETGHLVPTSDKGSQSVPSIRLDTYFMRAALKPDVVKIDIEGAELDALRGMERLFSETPPQHILIEVHAFYQDRGNRTAFNLSVQEVLVNAGYALKQLDGRAALPAEQWPDRIHIHGELVSSHE